MTVVRDPAAHVDEADRTLRDPHASRAAIAQATAFLLRDAPGTA